MRTRPRCIEDIQEMHADNPHIARYTRQKSGRYEYIRVFLDTCIHQSPTTQQRMNRAAANFTATL